MEEDSEEGEEEEINSSQDRQTDSQNSLTRTLGKAKLESPSKSGNLYDFEEEEDNEENPPLPKKNKSMEEGVIPSPGLLLKKRKAVYQHKWTAGEEEEDEISSTTGNDKGVKVVRSRVRNIKEPHQCLESGEQDDLRDDLDYILSALKGADTLNLKVLSCTSLARKCISSQFRHFIRSQNMLGSVIKSLADSPSEQRLALSSSAVLYLLCRDAAAVPLDSSAAKLFSQLLRMECAPTIDPELIRHYNTVWEIFVSYLDKMEANGRRIVFSIKKEELSPSTLILEALVFVLTCCKEMELKTELLNVGILQWIVDKVDKLIKELSLCNLKEESQVSPLLVPLERCFRILEAMSSLLVNIVERCNANRRKIIETKINVYTRGEEGKEGKEEEETALSALASMFVFHEKAARDADNGIDEELCIEEPEERNSDEGEEEEEENGPREDGILERAKLGGMNEGEVFEQLRGVMNKASSHMEDSVLASHLALLIGCILQQNEESLKEVLDKMPDGKLLIMIEQLQRYLDFLKIAGVSPTQFRSMERIIDVMERLES